MTMGNEPGEKRSKGIEAVDKFMAMLEGGEVVSFSKDEADALKDVARAWLAMQALGWVGMGASRFFKWVGILIIAWLSFKAGLIDWIQEVSGK